MKEAEIPIGLCADHEKLVVSGSFIAHSTDNGLPLAEVCFSQQVCDALRRDVRVSIRLSEDLQDEVHIARRLRNKLLGVDEKNGLLWDQRRQLMKQKVYFTTGILSQEVANAENSFKKVNIMKEELWAKRSWISDRALRLFEEQELARLETESDVAKQRLKERMDILSSRFTVSNRVSSSGNNSRGSNSQGNIQGKPGERTSVSTHPEHNDNEASSSNDPEQKVHKLHIKLDLQTKQFVEMESKMEDMLVSVRLAEAKGPVIMNDARKTWIVRYRDLIHAKKQVYQLTLQKDALERQILGQEADVQAQNEVSTEAQALKTAIARYEKDLVKRRKQAMLSMKEVQGSVIDAFDAVARVNASNRALRRARQMKTMALSPEMYISSVYVCFPLEYSHYEIPTPRVRQLASFVHCLLFGLRHYCYSDTQTPICRRLSFGKSFLWWGIEQELDIEIDNAITSRSEARFQVQHMSWAVIVLTYNGLFSSALAMGEMAQEEAEKYRHIGSFLTERVKFIRDSVERAKQSIVLIEDTTKTAEKAAPGFLLLRGCQEAIYTLATAAQRDFLAIDARMCQLSWRGQQHFTSNLRTQQIMEDVRAELQHVEDYLQVLKKKDDTVYKVGTHKRSSTAKVSSDETGDQGMRIPAVQAVYEFYARQQWSRLCVSETTAIGERLGLLRKSLEAASKNASPGAETEQGNEDVDDLLQRLRVVELSALLNRFECRIAEKTSESLRELLTKLSWDANDPEMANRPQDFLNAVLPPSKLQRWMFNVSLFTVDKEKMLESLRQVTTEDDPRDIGGNLSEVIFGASLDQNAIKQVYLVKSKTHVEEQWNVALVVLFFARLFRRASLRKAALQRKVEGSKFTTQRLERIQRSRKFIEYLTSSTRNGQDAAAFEPSMRELLHHVVLHRHECNASFPFQRVIYGLSMNRPCHRLLGPRNTNQHQEIVQLADSFDDAMAIAGHRPPRPTGLEVVQIDKYSVKIQWTQAPSELGLIHVAEITEWKAKYADSVDSTKIFWQQFVCTEKTSHTFYNLSPNKAYWVRVRAGFSRTRLGEACYPLLVTLGSL
ncbi:hypothetical protein Poli38472_005280 [Pythium oligandrum]|uniref:Fibronectin type-III domain-containing protein n=1 Tax=Pythium oligandrum TaxID=41045 RepID=A0A8K1CG14_PYTOL|nr:hypothetical protein Poli38472_005280 [Pythium oligandrum]|eukprot:TMW62662.1 hypothetical protein Poli38472_005280 [Pythium oligandrum]